MVLAVNIAESPEKVQAWATERKLTMPIVLDTRGAVSHAYNISTTPTVYLIGRDGKFVGKAVGPKAWTSAQSSALLEALLGP